jgi:hypothetical protein
MTLTVSTSFATGTINTASGTNISLATGTAVAGWVGRAIVLNRTISDRGGQWREITAVNSTTSITIASAWNTGSGFESWNQEILPQNGDAFHISHFWDDIDDTTNVLRVDARLYRNVAGLILSGNVTIYDKNVAVDLQTPTVGTANEVIIGTNSGIIQAGCLWIFNYATVTAIHDVFGTSAQPAGDLILIDSVIKTINPASISGSQGPFMRLNRGTNAIMRFLGCKFDGMLSGRLQGTRSAVKDSQFVAGLGTFWAFTTQSPIGLIDKPIVIRGPQAFYWSWVTSASGTVRGLNASQISGALISMHNTGSTSTVAKLTLIDLVYDNSAPLFITIVNTGAVNTTNKVTEDCYSLNIRSFLSGTLNGGGRCALFNNANTAVYNQLSSDGLYPESLMVLRSYDCNAPASTPITIARDSATRSTLLAPYTLRAREYGYQWVTQTFSGSEPASFTWFKALNTFVTAANSAAALAVTNPTTANQIYDHSQATYAGETYMQHAEAITTTDGVTLNLNCNVQINSALSAIAYTPATPAIAISALTAGTFRTLALGASRTITLVQAAVYAAPLAIPATGTVSLTAAGLYDLRTWTFADGAVVSSGETVTVIVATPTLVTQLNGNKSGAGITFVVPAPTIVINGFQPNSNVVISYAGQTLSILNNTSPPFTYTLPADLNLPATLSLVITKSGFETYTQGVAVVADDVVITVAQIPEGSSDTYNSSQVEFQALMIADTGFLRVLAGATAGLADEVKAVRLANFTDAAVKASWALLVAQTVPTSGEIVIWQGYLASTGYSAISFNSSTGVVS